MTNYYASQAISHSDLKLIDISIKSYLNKLAKKTTQSMEFGKLFHSYFLEKKKFASDNYITNIDLRTKAFKNLGINKNIIKKSDFATIYEMSKSINDLTKLVDFNANYKVEHELYFKYENVNCRSKIDYVNFDSNYFVDLKTINDITGAVKQAKYNYITQIAFYKIALNTVYNQEFEGFLIFVEKEAPYNSVVIKVVNDELLKQAEFWIKFNIDKWLAYLEGFGSIHYINGYIEL